MKNKTLTLKQFNLAIKHAPRMKSENLTLAKKVLVDNKTYRNVAEEANCHLSNVTKAVTKIYDLYLTKVISCPEGWIEVSVCLPTQEAVSKVRKMEQDALKQHQK